MRLGLEELFLRLDLGLLVRFERPAHVRPPPDDEPRPARPSSWARDAAERARSWATRSAETMTILLTAAMIADRPTSTVLPSGRCSGQNGSVNEAAAPGSISPFSPARFAAVFGSAIAIGQASQLVWLTAGSRTMSRSAFGTVLAAQALYGLLQYVVDNGPAFYGARLAAQGGLDDEARGSLDRVRLQAALAAAAVALAIGAAAGASFLTAIAPFALALCLFALFAYWERFGLGESGPWSAYVAGRSGVLALAALGFLAAGARFPLPLVGLLECAVILGAALAFRLRPDHALVLALRARRGPWRKTLVIGFPMIVSQVGIASGTVLLGATGAAASAATLAVSMRLLTGLNQLSGLVVTSLFPRLARHGAEADGGRTGASVVVAMRIVFALTALANAVLLAAPELVVRLFLNQSDREAEATAMVTLGSAAAAGYLLVLTMVLVARHRESVFLLAYAVGTSLILAGGIAVVAVAPEKSALWMAVALAAGLLAGAAILARRARTELPDLRRPITVAAVGAWIFAGLGAFAAAAPAADPYLAAGLALVGLGLVGSIAAARRRAAA
jgi:O-antigen/teichoic acid export membrane protein